jgi:hypothetical protein
MNTKSIAEKLQLANLTAAEWPRLAQAVSDLIPITHTGIAIDGGGVLGIGPAQFLANLGYKREAFLAGTSTGAILVALRGKGMEWAEILDMFGSKASEIFKNPASLIGSLARSKYKASGLEKLLKFYLGDLKMKDLKKPTYITAADFQTGRPKVFDRSDDVLVRDVVRCSTAAPTYFAPVGGRYADGGLWANNPVLVALAGFCDKEKVHPLRCRILSLGTGGEYWKPVKLDKDMGLVEWAMPLINYLLEGTESGPQFIASTLWGDRRIRRLAPKLDKEYTLDAVKLMPEYAKLWAEYERQEHDSVLKWLEVVYSNSN